MGRALPMAWITMMMRIMMMRIDGVITDLVNTGPTTVIWIHGFTWASLQRFHNFAVSRCFVSFPSSLSYHLIFGFPFVTIFSSLQTCHCYYRFILHLYLFFTLFFPPSNIVQSYLIICVGTNVILSVPEILSFFFLFFVASFSLSFFFSFWIFSFRNVLIIIIIFQLIQKHPTNEDSTSKLDRSTGIDQSLDCSKFTPKSEQSPYASTLSRATTQCHAYTQCCVYTQRLHAPLRLHV